jgi:FAS-associated factor 1
MSHMSFFLFSIPAASSSSSSGPKVTNNGFFPPQNSFEDKILQFSIHYNSQVYDLTINNRSTIEDLKTKINDLTGVPNCRQALKGWPTSKQREAQINTTVLRSLHLLAKTSLYLTDLTAEGFLGDGDVLTPSTSKAAAAVATPTAAASTSNVNYTLHINLQPAGQIHKLKFPEKQTVLSVKTDVYTVTNIPVRHQVWSGWPNNVSDSKTLGELGIEFEHNLVLQQSNDTNKPINTTTTSAVQDGEMPAAVAAVTTTTASSSVARNRAGSSVIEIDSDSSLEEFEDASEDFNPDDDMFSESPAQPRIKHLSE